MCGVEVLVVRGGREVGVDALRCLCFEEARGRVVFLGVQRCYVVCEQQLSGAFGK